MRIGLGFLPADRQNLTRAMLVESARAVEAAGYDGLWFFDAMGRGDILPDPLIGATLAASVTDKLEVGTCILQVPLRRPVELAHRILTTHLMCEGRFSLGVGVGSTKGDFDFVGLDFSQRMADMDAALPIMQQVWRDEEVNGHRLSVWPKALGGPPILIGSWAGKTWIPRAAKDYNGWIASGAKSTYGKLQDGIGRFRDAGGTRAIVTNIQIDFTAPTQDLTDETPFNLRCDPATARERFKRLVDLGYDDAIFVLPDFKPATLDEFAKVVGK
jgi:alkanesulfonate monooxygenase SsuD/methylene tetrahydromethanopterin reductase-like flavin-dependent oxidoreductase (luciferase family)